jgi:glycosyltransferase involved in cell wall biosynthesis
LRQLDARRKRGEKERRVCSFYKPASEHDVTAQAHVSIIIPTYNRASLLTRAIESVLAQTYEDFEVIIVDDGSTDNTADVISRIRDDRLVYHRLTERGGAANARNVGIEQTQGPLVAFQDSDDAWAPDKLELQIKALASATDRAAVCVCSFTTDHFGLVDEVRWKKGEMTGEETTAHLAGGDGYATPSLLIKREALDRVGGFDTHLLRMQDYELTLRIARHYNFVMMDEILVRGTLTADSLSTSATGYADALERILEVHADIFVQFPAGKSQMLFNAGKYLALEDRARESIIYFRRSWRARRTNIRPVVGAVFAATGIFKLLRKTVYHYIGPR